MARDFHSTDSEAIDSRLGLRVPEIEAALLARAKRLRPSGTMANFGEVLHGGHQTWVGLDPEVLNTPYPELVQMCHLLKPGPGTRVVDLGAGYGRLGFVLGELYPEVSFLGFELVPERVKEGNRVFRERGLQQATLFEQDLTAPTFTLPVAEAYFLYDFGKVSHIRMILRGLSQIADRHRFGLIARGKGTRSLIDFEHPWLTESYRSETFSLYSF